MMKKSKLLHTRLLRHLDCLSPGAMPPSKTGFYLLIGILSIMNKKICPSSNSYHPLIQRAFEMFCIRRINKRLPLMFNAIGVGNARMNMPVYLNTKRIQLIPTLREISDMNLGRKM